MKVTANLKDVYIPKFNGNRELPPEQQITVDLKRPNLSDRGNLKSIRMSTDQKDFSFSFSVDRILRQFIGKITNLESEVNGTTVVIGDGKALANDNNPALEPLVNELCTEVTASNVLDEDEVKN